MDADLSHHNAALTVTAFGTALTRVYHGVEEELEKTDESDTTSVSGSAVTDVMASDERVEDSAPDEDFAVDPCEAEDLEVEETGEGTMDD
ncbi:hypothetical protein C3L33_11164, partial [Rhododendron williamsianum]